MARERFQRALAALTACLVAASASAAPVHLLAERDTPTNPGQDLFLLTFPTVPDMVASANLTQRAVSIPLANSFSIAGFTIDGSGYHLLAERDTPTNPGQDLFLLSFPTLDDLVNGANLTQRAVTIPLANSFSVGGFTNDAAGYHLLAERDTATNPGQDLFLLSFPTLDNLIASANLTQRAVAIPLANSFSVGGFANDPGGYYVLAERDTATNPGQDLFLLGFPSLQDVVDGTNLNQQAVTVPLANSFSIGGFAIEPPPVPPPPPVGAPEPGTTVLLLAAAAAAAAAARRRRH